MDKLIKDNIVHIVLYSLTMYGLSSLIFVYVLLFDVCSFVVGDFDINVIRGLDEFMDSFVMRLLYDGITYNTLWMFILSILVTILCSTDVMSILLVFKHELVNRDSLVFILCNGALMAFQYAILLDVYVVYRCMLATLFFLLLSVLSAILYCVLDDDKDGV